MEMLDFVDENDQVLGQASRDHIHQACLMHRACHMMVFNSSGDVFLQKRGMHKDHGPGLWDFSAAGHVDVSESYLDCAVRELEEELGIRVDKSVLAEQFKLNPAAENGFEFSMVYTLISDAPIKLEPVEIEDGKWLSPEAVDEWIATAPEELTPGFVQIWPKLQPPTQ